MRNTLKSNRALVDSSRSSTILILGTWLVLSSFSLRAQSVAERPIVVRTLFASVPVIVTDRSGRHVPGLNRTDFKVTTAGKPTEIVHFSDAEVPLHVALVLDTSGSVSAALDGIKKAAKQFLDGLGPDDKCMVVTFGDEVRVVQEFTANKDSLARSIDSVRAIAGGTALMDRTVLDLVQGVLSKIKGRKAMIVLTDAGEINPQLTPQMMDELVERDTIVYSIYYPTPAPWFLRGSASMAKLIAKTPVGVLSEMAAVTGGRLLLAEKNDFRAQFQKITDELKRMYVLGFYPEESSDGSPNQIDMRTVRPDLVLRVRRTIRPKVGS